MPIGYELPVQLWDAPTLCPVSARDEVLDHHTRGASRYTLLSEIYMACGHDFLRNVTVVVEDLGQGG